MQVAAQAYPAWKTRLPALRTLEDARLTDALRALNVPDAKGCPRPEVLYGRRKMTQWLRRNGLPEASKHTVDRLMREEGMNGLTKGRKMRTTIPGKDGRRAGDLLNRDFTALTPNQVWVTDFTYVPHNAIRRHCSTNAVSFTVEVSQPTIAREYRSMTKAT
ncbi:IS3 family transposase [Arthrobacter flavus]|uniref:IS3 family transposase n=1 Tax=Arthrobacter flavus TaxID=95172 RepID=A0ABW4Q7T7_9MICC